jgi:transcriptional regulator with XRE-family HTH domain
MRETLGRKVKRARIEMGLSLRSLSRESGLAMNTLRSIEADARRPSGPTLFKLAEALHLDVDEMLDALEGAA